jgi:hypothetical protein
MSRAPWVLLCACALLAAAGCAARSAALPTVEVRLAQTPAEEAPRERLRERLSFNVTLIDRARLRYERPAELLGAAASDEGGDPQRLMQAGRSLHPGHGVVLLGTVRSSERGGGSKASVLVYQLALGCPGAVLEGPGDLKDCRGYLLRVPRTWPAEVYELEGVTLTLIPDGGTASGRLRARSVPGGFRAELEGEFLASRVELHPPGGVAAAAE